jgi:cytochrome c peroxidase
VLACATCHPGGSDDGLVWFIDTPTIPLKRRRTPHLANSHSDTAPFHWDGSFATMSDLVTATITDLMAGDDLLVDPTSVQAFVDEMVLAPIGPAQDSAAVARGQTLFQSTTAGCAGCHSAPDLTDDLNHAVLNPMSLSSDDVFTSANTPSLHGLFVRAPFFHDGRSPSLNDLLTRADASGHGDTSALSSSDISDLIAYLESL